ncbi:hypothetical protein GGS21DRAFT_489296 [Xylaria nigripes]|nr:hypothetical protein GGS21DRAFT_489296 [Xylaria nigripes]
MESIDDNPKVLEMKPMESASDVTTPVRYKDERHDDAYAGGGGDVRVDYGDGDNGDGGRFDLSGLSSLSGLPGQSTPRLSMSQSATPSISSTSKKMAKYKDKALLPIEDVYPALFLPLTRANMLKIENDSTLKSLSYPWKDDTVEIDNKQLTKFKSAVHLDVAKHFAAFGTSKCFSWAIKVRFPWLDCSTRTFRELRHDAIHRMGNFKHGLLYEKLYSYLAELRDEHPDITNMNDVELVKFLGDRFDKNLAKNLWAQCWRVLDFERTFANRDSLGAWCLRQVFLNVSIRMLPLITKELAMNPKLKWNKKAPSGWIADRDGRKDISGFFDCLCIAPELSAVELEDFVWLPEENPAQPPRGARKRNASQLEV